jgi:ATP-dependent DNA ligase
MYNIDDFPMMTPMKYYNNEDTSNAKRQAMIDNKDGEYIATKKNDGDWAMLIHWEKGKNLVRSRSISKVTGVYGDYTAKVPHIVEEMDAYWPDNTVVLAELCWDQDGTNANTVGTILRCLPAKAVERQKENKLKAVIFDLLMVDGKDLTNLGYYFRLEEVLLFPRGLYTYPTEVITQDFAEAADRIIAGGGEGIVIQRCDYTYNPGNRTAWKTLKLKQQLPEMELKVVGVLEPNMLYEGDCPETWEYKMMVCTSNSHTTGAIIGTEMLVTKPYYFGWKNGITVELPSGITTDVASGLTDDDRAWLATEDAAKMIEAGELYAVVKCMSINDLGKLRHPSLVRLRNDM